MICCARCTSRLLSTASAMWTWPWQSAASFPRSCKLAGTASLPRSIAHLAMFTARSPIRSRSTTTFKAVVMKRSSLAGCRDTRRRPEVSSTASSRLSTSRSDSSTRRARAESCSSVARMLAATLASALRPNASSCSLKRMRSAREDRAARARRAGFGRTWSSGPPRTEAAACGLPVGGGKGRLSLHRHRLERLLHLVHHGLRQRSVVQRGSALLAVVERPPGELEQRVSLGDVLLVLVDEQVGEGRERPGVLAFRVGDRDAVVVRHLHLRGRCRGGGQRCLDPAPIAVLQLGGGQLVLVGVGELDVSHGALGLLHHAGDALVALSAQTGRPVHAGPLPGSRLPVR